MLINDAKEQIITQSKQSGSVSGFLDQDNRQTTTTITNTNITAPVTTAYATALINPPPHTNPKLAAREGIKAWQFVIIGPKDSKISHLTNQQLKDLINNIILGLGFPSGKLYSVTGICEKGIIIEADSDSAARWLANEANQKQLCEKINPAIKFQTRVFTVIALNVPTDMDPKNPLHTVEICEANNLKTTPPAITATS